MKTNQIMMDKVVSLSDRRQYPRVSDAIALRLDNPEAAAYSPLDPVPTHVVKMSCSGLRFLHDSAFESDSQICLSVHLTSSDKTIQINSRVVSSGEEKTIGNATPHQKPYYVQVEFQNLTEQSLQLLKSHIDQVIEKTGIINRDTYYTANH